MIAVRLLTQDEVKNRLARFGAELVDPSTLKTAGIWRTMWGHHFTVPQEGPDKRCSEYALEKIIADLERQKPIQH